MRINFEEIKYREIRYEKNKDGKLVKRQKTFSQTVNPFNKNSDGSVKTREEVFESVKLEALNWKNKIN